MSCKAACDYASGGDATLAEIGAADAIVDASPPFQPAKKGKCACGKWAVFGEIGDSRASRCRTCSRPADMDICSRRCIICHIAGTTKHPGHGDGWSSAHLCAQHGAERGYYNTKNPRCVTRGCSTRACYGPFGGTAVACARHGAPLGFVNVLHPRCPCPKQRLSSFALPGQRPVCCESCADHGTMVNVIAKRCPCGLRMTFGFPDSGMVACASCAIAGMVNLSNLAAKCVKCRKTCASFGAPGGPATHCRACAGHDDNLVDVYSPSVRAGK
jgi:EsV-1-7 cysteine-rich motif